MSTPDTKLTIELATLLKGLQPTLKGLGQVEKSLKAVANIKPRDTQRNLRQTADASKRLADTQQRLINRQKNLEAATLRANNALDRARLSTQRLEQAKSRLARSTLPQLERQLNKVGRSLTSIGGGLKSFGATLTVGLTAPLTALGVLATKNAVSLDSLKRGLAAITGSAQDAAVQLERLREIAKAPGIGFQEAIQGSIRLQAVGFSAREAERALIQFANAVALTGGGRDELERVTVQLGQLAAKGKVVAQDLKPIIEAAPAVGQALLQAFGTVNSEDIQKLGLSTDQFLNKLLDALDDLPKAAAGARNAFENFSDSVFVASSAIGEAILPPLTRIINTLEPIILDLAEKFRSLSPEIQTAVIAIGALAAAAGPVLFVLGGIVTGIGTLITALGAVVGVIGTIGLPALAVAIGGIVVIIGEWVAILAALGLAWKENFLDIQGLVSRAGSAIVRAFKQIRDVINEAVQRILPTLESITTKVLNAVRSAWELYGKRVVEIVGDAFDFILDVTKTFVTQFGNVVDLILKLIDGDWRGAWQAFARIVVTAVDGLNRIMARAAIALIRGFATLLALIALQAIKFARAAHDLALSFVTSLATEIVNSAPQIREAIVDMFLLAAAGFSPGTIAAILVAKFIAALRKAAAEGVTNLPDIGPHVGADVGGEAFRSGAQRKGRPRPAPGDDKAARGALNKLQELQDEAASIEAEGRLANTRSAVEQQFQLTKDGLERELSLLDANFEDRLVTVKKFFAERKRLQEAEIDSELVREKALSAALTTEFENRRKEIQREFKSTVDEIQRDPKLKGRAQTLALQSAEQKKQNDLAKAFNEFESQNADASTRILVLQEQRKRVAADTTREEQRLTEELRKQQEQRTFDLLEAQGATVDAEGGRLKAQFKETLKELRVDVQALSPELQDALNNVDLTTLKSKLDQLPEPVQTLIQLLDIGIKRAQILENQADVDRTLNELQFRAVEIQNQVLDGTLSEKKNREQILALQLRYKAILLDILAAELARAKALGDQDEIQRIEQQIQEVGRLGTAFDEVGQDINRNLFGTIEDGFANFFDNARKGFDGLKDAAIQFGENLLGIINRLAAQSLTERLFGDLLKPDATNTEGTPGGFLSKLFGLKPQAPAGSALTAAAATAGTTLTTSATAAGAALTTGGATASATLVTGLTAAATAFSSAVIAAGAAFASTVAASGVGQAAGGLGAALGAATGIFPAVPGGMIRMVEGGFPEAVLTTDPKHAARQVQILKAYLKQTRGLFGRVRLPELAAGGLISPRDAEANLLSSIQRSPSLMSSVPDTSLGVAGSGQPLSVRVINQLTSKTATRPYLTSEEGVRDVLNIISANKDEIGRRIGVR